MGADEFTANGQKIVERQQQHLAQLDHDGLLRWFEGGLQALSGMTGVGEDRAALPATDAAFAHPIAVGQHGDESALAAISARTAGVMRALGCRAMIMGMTRLNWPTTAAPALASRREPEIAHGG